MVAPAVPELVEGEHQSVVDSRTDALATLRELGPPDLVHLTKNSAKSATKEIGVYHHVTGVDASSSASLAAYLNTLIYSPADQKGKVTSGLYCCYNAFSRLDMRVSISIPGGVESYCIDDKGDKKVASESLWLETYLCSVLRAYAYADDGTGEAVRRIVGCRRFNPIVSTEAEHRFLDAAERLFFNGWQLGSDPEIQVPNLVSNHLTSGLLNYIRTTGRFTSGINLFEKLRTRDPEISSLLAQVYISADEEVKAVRLLHDAIQELPMDYALLDTQAHFCQRKGRDDLSLHIAKRSVISAPSEFCTWARLAEVYIGLEQWDLALLTLNSCPMFTYQDKDIPPTPPPARINLPILPDTQCDEIDDANYPEGELVHPQLRKLVAGSFKGTFHKAYALLTEITKKIGWDQLLKIRSQVFVMEEEYRSERQPPGATPKTNGDAPSAPASADGDDGASPAASTRVLNGATPDAASPTVSKPPTTLTSEAAHAGSDNAENPATAPAPDPSHDSYASFRNKRLCERWLDNLFMVLYEDLRIFTIWRTEAAQARAQGGAFEKRPEEWEVLGDLASRLHYPREALEAWRECLALRFSPKAMKGIVEEWEAVGEIRSLVGGIIRLVCWQYRWYSEFSPRLYQLVRRLIENEGAVKVHSMIQATSLPGPVLRLTEQYTAMCGAFRSSGAEM